MTHIEPELIVESLLDDLAFKLVYEEGLQEQIAATNTTSWQLSTYTDIKAKFINSEEISFSADLTLKGEPLSDQSYLGSIMYTHVDGILVSKDGEWKIKKYNVLSAELKDIAD